MKLKKGILIVFEGIDGGGKTTQAKSLLSWLQKKGIEAVYFREPSDSKWGAEIREKAAQEASLTPLQELQLFQKDRKENIENNIKPALRKKQVVILDRYYFSTMAYQGAKGIDVQRIKTLNEKMAVEPDLVLILDVEAKQGLKRIEGRKQKHLLFEKEDYLIQVRRIFQSIRGENIFHVNGHQPVEKIASKIEQIVWSRLFSGLN